MYCPERFKHLTIRHFSKSYIMFLLVMVSGDCTGSGPDYTGLYSTHPRIILWSEEFPSLKLKYVHNRVPFDGGKLWGDLSWNNQRRCSSICPTYLFTSAISNLIFFKCLIFMPELTNTYVFELSFLRCVAGCFWSNAIKYVRMLIAFFYYWMLNTFQILLIKIPHSE